MGYKDLDITDDGMIRVDFDSDEEIDFWGEDEAEDRLGLEGIGFDNLDDDGLGFGDDGLGGSEMDPDGPESILGSVGIELGVDDVELNQGDSGGNMVDIGNKGDKLPINENGGNLTDRGVEEIEDIGEIEDSDDVEETEIITTNDCISDDGKLVVQSAVGNDRFKLVYIDITKIAVVKRVRTSKNIDDLLESIKSTGLLNPIVVAPTATDGIYVLINGYRRLLACAKLGLKEIPSIVNTKIETKDIIVLEALYNRYKPYTITETVNCIEYLKNEKGIQSTSMIEYLLQLDSGDCSKLQDVLEDNDDDIVTPLMNEQISIAQAFKKLEQRRKKESKEEKEGKQVSKVYNETEEQVLDDIRATGEEVSEDEALTDEEIESLAISNDELSESENESLDCMVEHGKEINGFEDKKQDYKHREHLDPALRKSVLARDDNTCMCCGLHGQEYVGVFDVHHKVEVYLGGSDAIDNLITVCTVCHRLIHSYGRGELYIRPEEDLSEDEKVKFKKIVKLGNKIREGMAMKGMKKEQLKKVDNLDSIGRTKPGTPIQQAT